MSRSLLAAHDALRSGRVRRVSHVKGGLYGYHLAGLPIEVRSGRNVSHCDPCAHGSGASYGVLRGLPAVRRRTWPLAASCHQADRRCTRLTARRAT